MKQSIQYCIVLLYHTKDPCTVPVALQQLSRAQHVSLDQLSHSPSLSIKSRIYPSLRPNGYPYFCPFPPSN